MIVAHKFCVFLYLNLWMFGKSYCDSTLTNVGIVISGLAHPKIDQFIGSLLTRCSFDMGEYQSIGLNIWNVVKHYVIDWKMLSKEFHPRSV
jgi:hypothetical protein